jgi:hypothetical protein
MRWANGPSFLPGGFSEIDKQSPPNRDSNEGESMREMACPPHTVAAISDCEESKVLCRRCRRRPVPLGLLRKWRYFCSKCYHALGKARRKSLWEAGERPHCRNHPTRMVNRSYWIARGWLVCSGCRQRNAAGDFRPTTKRKHARRTEWRRTAMGKAYDRKIKRLYVKRLRGSRMIDKSQHREPRVEQSLSSVAPRLERKVRDV